jgi:hypothetical protein
MTPIEQAARTTVHTWQTAVGRLGQLLSSLSDEDLQKEVAPGRNRAYYLVGHLAAIHDRLFPLLGLGERLHPELDEPFVTQPDRAHADEIAAADLRQLFAEVHAKLNAAIEALPAADWLLEHTAVSDEDFAKDPLRNRLAVLQSRANHAMFHAGQIRLVWPAEQ